MPDEWTEAMLDGAFERAWAICDRVLRERQGQSCTGLPRHLHWVWDGAPLAGRRVLVRCYHGLGDTLQFVRFVPRLTALASAVVVEAQPSLLPLLSSVYPMAELRALDTPLPAWDVALESMELPHALRVSIFDLPGRIPYLVLPPGRRRRRRSQRLQVGLVWAAGDWRHERSIPPSLLMPIAGLPLDLIGLQQGPARRDPAAACLTGALRVSTAENASIAETAALICDLDILVTVDTMVAHLAGALGRPVWTLLDAKADWRWMRRRTDSPWYPTMRLFRQPQPGIWEPPINDIAVELMEAAQRHLERDRPPSC